MKLSDFDYNYPKELIAQCPLDERDASRMMVIDRRSKTLRHSLVSLFADELREGDLLIINDSKVDAVRLFGTRGGGEPVEILLIEPYDGSELKWGRGYKCGRGYDVWRCLLKRAKNVRVGEKFYFGMQACAIARGRDGIFLLLEFPPRALNLVIKHHGVPPLPPYIERDGYGTYTKQDRERYQTVYAHKPGSAAAPTAGLHLSKVLLDVLCKRGIGVASVTLHVGIDTFTPVRTDEIKEHHMHGERYEISEKTALMVSNAKAQGRRVIAVGTTSARALESAAKNRKDRGEYFIEAYNGVTDLFITPGFQFHIVDALLTNFHQPKSTLLMLVSAFANISGDNKLSGRDLMLTSYTEAIRERYRLFSYGDCMFVT